MPNTIRIVIDTSELEHLHSNIGQALTQLRSTVVNDILTKELEDSTDRAFQNEADPNTGQSWEPWSARYSQHLAKLNKRHKILQDKGMGGGGLRSTIQTTANGREVTIGSNLRYARIHQLGGGNVRPGFPARPYLGLDEKSRGKIERKIGRVLADMVDRATR